MKKIFMLFTVAPVMMLGMETPRTKTKSMEYELMSAAEFGSPAAVDFLLKKYQLNPNVVSRNIGRSALMRAADKGHNDVISLLLQEGADINIKTQSGYTALMLAANSGHVKTVDLLLKKGADPNMQNNFGATALMRAIAGEGRDDEIKVIVKLLLKAGADINLHDKDGKTALDYAKETLNEEIVKLLKRAAR